MTESGNGVVTINVTEEFHIAKAQIASELLAKSIGFSDVGSCCVATGVSELANNPIFHTRKGGTITMIAIKQDGKVGIEIIAEDEGPGTLI